MGKIHFPLVNIRRDINNNWKMRYFGDGLEEEILVPLSPNSYGFYTTWLTELPDNGSVEGVTSRPQIQNMEEFKGLSCVSESGELLVKPNQFFINYKTGEILFHPQHAGKKFRVAYWGKGSIIEADVRS